MTYDQKKVDELIDHIIETDHDEYAGPGAHMKTVRLAKELREPVFKTTRTFKTGNRL